MKPYRKAELKHDAFTEAVLAVLMMISAHRRLAIAIGVAFVIIVAAILGTLAHRRARSQEAWNALQAVAEQFQKAQTAKDVAAAEEFDAAVRQGRKAFEDHPDTLAGQLALLAVADAYYGRNDYRKAADACKQLLATSALAPEVAHRGRRSLAQSYEQLNEYGQAAKLFQQDADLATGAFRAESLYDAGRCLARAGRVDAARDAYGKAVALAPSSFFARLAAASLGELNAKPGEEPATAPAKPDTDATTGKAGPAPAAGNKDEKE